mgnify:CR=1 FL=1
MTNRDEVGSHRVNFTITGTDADGDVITEDITYNLAAGMVHGTKAFHTVTKVATDKTLQGNVTVGTYQVGDRIEAKGNLNFENPLIISQKPKSRPLKSIHTPCWQSTRLPLKS